MAKVTRRAPIARSAMVLFYAAVVLPYLRLGTSTAAGYDRYLLVNLLLLLFGPLLLILLAFGQSLPDYALDRGDARVGARFFLILFPPALFVYIIAARHPLFYQYYPMYTPARFSLRELLYWEITYNTFYMFCWEFFFRGFLLFGLRPALGNHAIWVQALAFGVMHWGKPAPEFWVSFLTGLVLGLVALRSRSILPTWGLHAASAISFDLLALAWSGQLLKLLHP